MSGKEIARFVDEAMFVAEKSEKTSGDGGDADYRPRVTLLDAPNDPLGKLAHIAKAYQGKFLKSYDEITDEDRRYYIQDMEKNVLGMPSEAVQFHFLLENVTRSFTHQLVRTRHACLVGDTRVMGGSYHADRNEHNPTIRDLYENRKVAGGTKQIKILTVNESGIIVRNKIKDIWEVGVRQVFTLKTHDGRSITATGNHPFQRPDGTFTNLEDLSVGELVMCIPCHRAMDRGTYPESVYPSTIVSIEPAGEEMVYDLEMDGEYPWFVANGLVVHNSYAQESMRFAVKEDFPVQLPPHLVGTLSRKAWRERELGGVGPAATRAANHIYFQSEAEWFEYEDKYASDSQKARFVWDETIAKTAEGYQALIDMGMPAEDARGLAPHAIVTKINWVVDLRALMATAGQRLCTQAQFEHREMWNSLIASIRDYGRGQKYWRPRNENDDELNTSLWGDKGRESSAWQFDLLADRFKPICYQTGRCQFRSDFDRYCNIRDRVELNHKAGRPSSKWHLPLMINTTALGPKDYESIPAIDGREWLRPDAAISREADWRTDEALNNIQGRR